MTEEGNEGPFAEEKRQYREFLEMLDAAEETELCGLVSASGAGGASLGDGNWFLVFHFAAWKQAEGKLRKEELRVETPMPELEMDRYRDLIDPYDIVRVRARVAWNARWNRWQATASEIILGPHEESDLEAIATELRQPVTIEDPVLGTFTLDRRVTAFDGKAKWQEHEVRISLDGFDVDASLATARGLWSDQKRWSRLAADHAVETLLDILNSNWLDEGEEELSREEFLERITLEIITTSPGGKFDFWYDDDYLFGGHAIQVSGNLEKGLASSDLAG